MNCPYCRGEMTVGALYAPDSHATYWLPKDASPAGIALSEKRIEACGGLLLGKVSKLGFLSLGRPKTYRCAACGLLLTKQDPSAIE